LYLPPSTPISSPRPYNKKRNEKWKIRKEKLIFLTFHLPFLIVRPGMEEEIEKSKESRK
jgi:hypothetical protein